MGHGPTPAALLATRLGGAPLSGAEWRGWMEGVAAGAIPPYQHAALQVSAAVFPLSGDERAAAQAAMQRLGDGHPGLGGAPGLGCGDLFGAPLTGAGPGDPDLPPLLARKIRGDALPGAEIAALVASVARGRASDAQVAALCAAIFLRGMDPDEVARLTHEMTHTGDVLELGPLPGPALDKHSTGGVGDKVSLPLAGVLAACGAYVPMVSGRGLGHTGGTLDKLEAIPGLRVNLSPEEIRAAVARVGAVIVGQTGQLAPADKRMYAIRDVTSTVSSIPLITASILSKKLAEGLDALCMDVKVGSGAFMKEEGDARALASSLVAVGEALSRGPAGGMKVRALLTGMDRPLGRMLGNALEVRESLDLLRGAGPEDVRSLVVGIAARLLVEGGICAELPAAAERAAAALRDGSAFGRFRAMVEAQGGDARALDEPDRLPTAPAIGTFDAPADGFVLRLDALTLGQAVVALGGGRRVAEDEVDPAVGLEILAPVGARVRAGEPLLRIHARSPEDVAACREALTPGIVVGPPSPSPQALPLILGEL